MNISIFARSMGLLLAGLLAASIAGCDEGSTGADGGSGGSGGDGASGGAANGGSGGTPSTGGGGSSSQTLSVIDDMEDGDGSILAADGRKGAWYTYNDETATAMQAPEVGVPFEMAPNNPPRDGSAFSANTKGSGFATWGAGFGFDLNNDGVAKGPYDGSKYAGITFWAKVGPGAAGAVRVNIGDKNTAPEGGVCDNVGGKCNDDFGKDINITESWQKFDLEFSKMAQVGWSMALQPAIDKAALYSVHFQTGADKTFDIWIDDIALYE